MATAWHVACGRCACEGAGVRDNMAADRNEPWMKLEKRYKEYRNPVLILTHGLQTRLCCRFVENHGLKEWHWLGSWAPRTGLTPLSVVSAQRYRAVLVPAYPGMALAPPRLLPSSLAPLQEGTWPRRLKGLAEARLLW